MAGMSLDRRIVRIDEIDAPGEAAAEKIARDGVADRTWPVAGADECHRRGPQELVQISDGHRLFRRRG